jgi:heme o synthase
MTDIRINPTFSAQAEAGFGDYVALLKPRVMSLVVFTALAGLLVAPVSLHPFEAAVAVLFIALGGGASGALNMWWDWDGRCLRAASRRAKPWRSAWRCRAFPA